MRALVAFAAAARLGNFARAGDELGMTQSAVSHQIRMLEDHLRQPLFNRLHRNAVLTDAGRDLAVTLGDCFERLELGLKRLEQYRKPNQVVVYAPAAFASRWLLPRLPSLRAAQPELDLWLFSNSQTFEPLRGEIHVAILPATDVVPGLETRLLFPDFLAPLCAPQMAAEPKPLRSVADLLKRPLLHDERREDWSHWLAAAGAEMQAQVRGYNFGDSGALLEAAARGMGVALGSLALADEALHNGTLVAPFRQTIPADSDWVAALTGEALAKPKIQAFLSWLEAEAARTRDNLAVYSAASKRQAAGI